MIGGKLMRDNHLHTYFSYDSDTDFRDYLEHYDGEIVTTEHLDLSNPYPYNAGSPHDDIPDYKSYSRKIAFLNKKYGNRIKKGIEIGYYRPRKKDTLAFLEYKDYDLKLLSVHHNGKFDYLEAPVLQLEKMQWIPDYLKELEEAIESIPAHVLAHFDYGFRKFNVTVEELKNFEPQLRALFQKMIEYNLAFELNCKSMYLYNHEDIYIYALSLVQELGGTKYSVGSDAHTLEHFRLNFDQIKQILTAFGIGEAELL